MRPCLHRNRLIQAVFRAYCLPLKSYFCIEPYINYSKEAMNICINKRYRIAYDTSLLSHEYKMRFFQISPTFDITWDIKSLSSVSFGIVFRMYLLQLNMPVKRLDLNQSRCLQFTRECKQSQFQNNFGLLNVSLKCQSMLYNWSFA